MMIRCLPLFASLLLPTCLLAQGDKPADHKKPADTKPADAKPADAKKGDAKIDFATQIWPILEQKCVECHSPEKEVNGRKKKPKGGVVLENKEAITTSKKGKLVVANDPDNSLLYKSITLAADDEDRMPPAKKGDPLPKEQTDLIKAWIQQGADFGTWTSASATTEKPKDAPAGKEKPADKPGEKPKSPHGEAPTDKPKGRG